MASLASRAVASANLHPVPNKFRQFCAPKFFEVTRKRSANNGKVSHLCKRLSFNDCHYLSKRTIIHSTGTFITDTLSFIKHILPNEVESDLENFHSFAKQCRKDKESYSMNLTDILDIQLEEQKKILADDDIVDDNSIGQCHFHNELNDVSVDIKKQHCSSSIFANSSSNQLRLLQKLNLPGSKPAPREQSSSIDENEVILIDSDDTDTLVI